jgi:hypothetical protein
VLHCKVSPAGLIGGTIAPAIPCGELAEDEWADVTSLFHPRSL